MKVLASESSRLFGVKAIVLHKRKLAPLSMELLPTLHHHSWRKGFSSPHPTTDKPSIVISSLLN